MWRTPIEGEVLGCPVVAPNGDIYLATHRDGGLLYRIDPTTGAILDQTYVPGAVENGLAMNEDGLLYLNTVRVSLAACNPYQPSAIAAAYQPSVHHG